MVIFTFNLKYNLAQITVSMQMDCNISLLNLPALREI